MERGAGVVSVQTLRAEIALGRGRRWARGPGPTGPGASSPPCPAAQINLCDTLQHFEDSLLLDSVQENAIDSLAADDGRRTKDVVVTTNTYNLFERFVLRILGIILGFKDTADWRDWEVIGQWALEVGEMI